MMVSLAIIGLLATISFFSAFQTDPDGQVHKSSEVVRTSLELSRTNSSVGLTCCGGLRPEGYGIYAVLDGQPDQEFFIYADIDGDHQYVAGTDEIATNQGLAEDVTFNSCTDTVTTIIPQASAPNTCDVSFYQDTLYFNGLASSGIVTITVQHTTVTSDTDQAFVYPNTLLIE